VSIETPQDVYVVDDVINCTARGWPHPKTQWRPVVTPQSSNDDTAPLGSSLRVVPDMVGWNVWECVAANSIDDVKGTEAVMRISFNVTGELTTIPYISDSRHSTIIVRLAPPVGRVSRYCRQ